MEDSFSMDQEVGGAERTVSGLFKRITFIVHFLYYYYIRSTSDHQALDPRGWVPMQDLGVKENF